jgi:hypothetical protein
MVNKNVYVHSKILHRINVYNRNCGFFSDFLTCLAGIMYCYDNGVESYVDWRSNLYSPTNELGECEYNLFDKYFYQENNNLDDNTNFNTVHNLITPYGFYFPYAHGHINPKSIYSSLYHPSFLMKELKILESDFFLGLDKNFFGDKKVLGVHKRGTDHGNHGPIKSNEFFLDEINLNYKNQHFDKIFLITDDNNSLEFFKRELGDDLIITDSHTSDRALHYGQNFGLEVIAQQVIRDSYYLSQCDYKLITRSNVSTFTLLCNLNENDFKFLDNDIKYR